MQSHTLNSNTVKWVQTQPTVKCFCTSRLCLIWLFSCSCHSSQRFILYSQSKFHFSSCSSPLSTHLATQHMAPTSHQSWLSTVSVFRDSSFPLCRLSSWFWFTKLFVSHLQTVLTSDIVSHHNSHQIKKYIQCPGSTVLTCPPLQFWFLSML